MATESQDRAAHEKVRQAEEEATEKEKKGELVLISDLGEGPPFLSGPVESKPTEPCSGGSHPSIVNSGSGTDDKYSRVDPEDQSINLTETGVIAAVGIRPTFLLLFFRLSLPSWLLDLFLGGTPHGSWDSDHPGPREVDPSGRPGCTYRQLYSNC